MSDPSSPSPSSFPSIRTVRKLFHSRPTIEGAGVKLQRGFSYPEARELDPFLLFDDFSSPDPRTP